MALRELKICQYVDEKYLVFENCAFLRMEDAHAKLKSYLQVSIGNLYQVQNKICPAIENKFQKI